MVIVLSLLFIGSLFLLILLLVRQQVKIKLLESFSMRDSATGIDNIYGLRERLSKAIAVSRRYGNQYVGLLRFIVSLPKESCNAKKQENIDTLAQKITERVGQIIRSSDSLARIGSLDFVILVPLLNCCEELEGLQNKIQTVFNNPFSIEDNSCILKVSFTSKLSKNPKISADSFLDLSLSESEN